MTFDELLILIERNNFKSKVDFTIAIKLFDAENDWPVESITINDFVNKVEMEIGDDIFYQNLVSINSTFLAPILFKSKAAFFNLKAFKSS